MRFWRRTKTAVAVEPIHDLPPKRPPHSNDGFSPFWSRSNRTDVVSAYGIAVSHFSSPESSMVRGFTSRSPKFFRSAQTNKKELHLIYCDGGAREQHEPSSTNLIASLPTSFPAVFNNFQATPGASRAPRPSSAALLQWGQSHDLAAAALLGRGRGLRRVAVVPALHVLDGHRLELLLQHRVLLRRAVLDLRARACVRVRPTDGSTDRSIAHTHTDHTHTHTHTQCVRYRRIGRKTRWN